MGAWSAKPKNASPGNGRAKSLMKSHSPRSMNASMRWFTSSRVGSVHAPISAGVKWTLISRLNARCCGGSMVTGRIFIEDGGVGTVMPSSELNVCQSWAMRSTSSYLVTTQNPP